MEQKFKLGQKVVTRAVHERMKADRKFQGFVYRSLGRHANGDWGDFCEEDRAVNEEALASGEARLFSAYIFDKQKDDKIWIITEWDRSVTTILFPEDY